MTKKNLLIITTIFITSYAKAHCLKLNLSQRYSQAAFAQALSKCDSKTKDLWDALQNSSVKINKAGEGFCAALLVNKQYLITASHCLAQNSKKPWIRMYFRKKYFKSPIAGKLAYSDITNAPPTYEVVKRDTENDRAIIKLSEPVQGVPEGELFLTSDMLRADSVQAKKHLIVILPTYTNSVIHFWPDRTTTYKGGDLHRSILFDDSFDPTEPSVITFFNPSDDSKRLVEGESGSPVFSYQGDLVGVLTHGINIHERTSKKLYDGKRAIAFTKIPQDWVDSIDRN